LRLAAQNAERDGFDCEHHKVVGDFHDLPFSDGWFDLVFIASAVHHTWRPWAVIQEALRVLRPGGVLRLENEPVARAVCFYLFRSNRTEQLTPFERAIESQGLTLTISSPFPGSRPEELFGMIENDRIPIDIYLNSSLDGADLLELELNTSPLIGDFELWLLSQEQSLELPSIISTQLHEKVQDLARSFDLNADLNGFSLPSTDDIWILSYKISEMLSSHEYGNQSPERLARLFGAALQLTVRKNTGVVSAQMYRRQIDERDGIRTDYPQNTRFNLTLQDVLPSLESCPTELADLYPADEFLLYREANGYTSALLLKDVGEIHLPCLSKSGVLLLRIYSVAAPEPYDIEIWVGRKMVYRHTVFDAESHMARLIVEPGTRVRIETKTISGQIVALPMYTRIGASRLFLFDEVSFHQHAIVS
jgi:hypothetical protein